MCSSDLTSARGSKDPKKSWEDGAGCLGLASGIAEAAGAVSRVTTSFSFATGGRVGAGIDAAFGGTLGATSRGGESGTSMGSLRKRGAKSDKEATASRNGNMGRKLTQTTTRIGRRAFWLVEAAARKKQSRQLEALTPAGQQRPGRSSVDPWQQHSKNQSPLRWSPPARCLLECISACLSRHHRLRQPLPPSHFCPWKSCRSQ